MIKLILDMLKELQKKDFRALLVIRDQIRESSSKNEEDKNTLILYLNKNFEEHSGKTLLELAFDTGCDETAHLIFSLYLDFAPDWPVFNSSNNKPLLLELLDTPERKALFYRVIIEWKPRTVEKRVYEHFLKVGTQSITVSDAQKESILKKLQNVPIASFIKGIAEHNSSKAIDFKKNYLENPLLQNSWKEYYQQLARTISENTNFVQKGPNLSHNELIKANMGLYFYKIFLDLLSYQRFFPNRDQFKPVLDISLEALKESSQYNSFFALQRICLHYMKVLTKLDLTHIKKAPLNIRKIEEFADKMLVHQAPGYLTAAFLYFSIAQHMENTIKDEIKDESKAESKEESQTQSYYLLAYYHLQVAMNIKDSEAQIYNAFLGIDCFQLLPVHSMEAANTFLCSYLHDDDLMIDRVKAQALSTANRISNERVCDDLTETAINTQMTEIDTSRYLEPIISRNRVAKKR